MADAPHTTTVRVRYSETDRMGVVYYANYLVYFEIGRTEQLRAMGVRYRDLEDQGYALVVVEARVQYAAPAKYDETLTIATRLAEVSHVRLRHEYEITGEDGRRVAAGHTVLACLGRDGKVRRLPKGLF
jgi:acyl-CoA thioester hydrolase